MKSEFYGKRIHPPTISIAKAFGSEAEPIPLSGGQGTSYRSGSIILKPAEGVEESNWIAEVFNTLPESSGVRFARPINSINREWIYEGYVAWSFLEGMHTQGHYDAKIVASRSFHTLLMTVEKPTFLEISRNSWSVADRVAMGELEFVYDEDFMRLFRKIKPHLIPLNFPNQVIHGDISGNFLLDHKLPPAIIDFSPAWAPNGFAEGIMLVDAVTWEGASTHELQYFKEIPHIEQFAWRGVLRRVAEQAEHIRWFHKDKTQALAQAINFQKAIDFLEEEFE